MVSFFGFFRETKNHSVRGVEWLNSPSRHSAAFLCYFFTKNKRVLELTFLIVFFRADFKSLIRYQKNASCFFLLLLLIRKSRFWGYQINNMVNVHVFKGKKSFYIFLYLCEFLIKILLKEIQRRNNNYITHWI